MRIIYIRSPIAMAVQILNDMPDAEVHRGDPVEESAARTERAARAVARASGRAVFMAITIGLHVGRCARLHAHAVHAACRKRSRTPIEATLLEAPRRSRSAAADIRAAADGRRVFAADAAGNHVRNAKRSRRKSRARPSSSPGASDHRRAAHGGIGRIRARRTAGVSEGIAAQARTRHGRAARAGRCARPPRADPGRTLERLRAPGHAPRAKRWRNACSVPTK